MAIKLNFSKTDSNLFGRSKMWGSPDMPDSLDYPEVAVNDGGELVDDPMTFICQIRLEDIAPYDIQNRLPHEGMLYFFGCLDYFFGNFDALAQPGMGEWDERYFKVLYSPTCDNLHTHSIVYDDGTEFGLPAEMITFTECADREEGFKLLGRPYLDEIAEQYEGWTSLLQLDEDDDWGLRFFDCGMLCFLIRENKIKCYLHSF